MNREMYNPMTGTRLDLVVTDEPEAVARLRWNAQRRAYLRGLIDDPNTSEFARVLYKRERAGLPKE